MGWWIRATPPPSKLYPGASWNGTAGSGYASSPPLHTGADFSARPEYGNMHGTIAPIAHWLHPVVTDEMFTADYTVVVSAFAAAAGDNIVGGIASVKFYCEGNTVTVSQLSACQLPVSGGGTRPVLGYKADIDYAAFSGHGAVDLYAEITPTLAGVASRIIGPMRMYRKAGFDKTIDIDPGQAVVTGSRYQTVQGALAYVAANWPSGQHWRLRHIANGVVDPTAIAFPSSYPANNNRGKIVVDANGFTVSLQQASWSTSPNTCRPGFPGLTWLGYRVDVANIQQYFTEPDLPLAVFRNCEIYSSNGAGELVGNAGQGVAKCSRSINVFRSEVSFEACYLHDFQGPNISAMALVGCRLANITGDSCNMGGVTYGPGIFSANTAKAVSGGPIKNRLNSIQLAYGGAGTATFSITGNSESNTRALLLRVNGSTVRTITASTAVGSGIYTMQDAVNDINAFGSGWSATLLDNTRFFAAIGSATTTITGGVSDLALSNIISAAFDPHVDGVQMLPVSQENNLVHNNFFTECEIQVLFPALGDATGYNIGIIQNAGQSQAVGAVTQSTDLTSQTSGIHKHLLIAQNSHPNQSWTIDRSALGATFDSYCRWIGNVAVRFDMTSSAATPWDIRAAGNLAFSAPVNAFTGTNVTTPTVSGSSLANYPNVASSPFNDNDFIPAVGQSVRTNSIMTQFAYDIFGTARGTTCPPGVAA